MNLLKTKMTEIEKIETEIATLQAKLEYLKSKESQTLLDIISEWCDDEDDPTCENLVHKIEEWLPHEFAQVPDEEYDIGWNECLQKIKNKLR